ncbi:MAG: DUF4215 domain-containing protein, partial [Candidatus Aenigmarchaeota archaeon]|nr:DUF4215 domain-containing protein [Candidatus Aenigmarchaeota archaeon]
MQGLKSRLVVLVFVALALFTGFALAQDTACFVDNKPGCFVDQTSGLCQIEKTCGEYTDCLRNMVDHLNGASSVSGVVVSNVGFSEFSIFGSKSAFLANRNAVIRYPVTATLSDGTLEAWISPIVSGSQNSFTYPRTLFQIIDAQSRTIETVTILQNGKIEDKHCYADATGGQTCKKLVSNGDVRTALVHSNIDWTHIAVSWGKDGRKIYLNGKLDKADTQETRQGFATQLAVVCLGRCTADASYTILGYVDEVRISGIQETNFHLSTCPQPDVTNIRIEGTCKQGSVVTVKCDVLWGSALSNIVKVWAEQCSADPSKCIYVWKSYSDGRAMYARNQTMDCRGNSCTYSFVVDQPVGTGIGAVCHAQNTDGQWSQWEDLSQKNPLCVVQPGIVDTTPPIIGSITLNKQNPTAADSVSVTTSASDRESGIRSIEIQTKSAGQHAFTTEKICSNQAQCTTDNRKYPAGNLVVNVIAINDGGLRAVQQAQFIIRNVPETIPPTVTMDPISRFVYSGYDVHFSARASDVSGIKKIQLLVDGSVIRYCDLSDTCDWTMRFYEKNIRHTYWATATDTNNNIATTEKRTFTVLDYIPPSVVITQPSAGSWHNGNFLVQYQFFGSLFKQCSFNIFDRNILTHGQSLHCVPVGSDITAGPTAYCHTNGQQCTVTVLADDGQGNVAQATRTFGIDTDLPVITSLDATFPNASDKRNVSIVASARDDTSGVQKIELFLDQNSQPSTTCTASLCRFNALFPVGTHTITATAADRAGNKVTRTQTFTASPQAPICGNGIVESREECDDGNTVNGDGCSNTCFVDTCVAAKQKGLITASLTNNQATIINHAHTAFAVGLASYKKYDEVIDHQTLFDSITGTVQSEETKTLSITVPSCAHQIDAFCGAVLTSLNGQRYGERLLTAGQFGGTNYCTSSHFLTISNVAALPNPAELGGTVQITATVLDDVAVDKVSVNVTKPDGTKNIYGMNRNGQVYQ